MAPIEMFALVFFGACCAGAAYFAAVIFDTLWHAIIGTLLDKFRKR